ncbi:MAG TPA: phosphatase PAP2 family protein [Gemmatimonadales bacterium]|nr:phosphatase PAP2 family protein [Gemmatimonadales bacterium]
MAQPTPTTPGSPSRDLAPWAAAARDLGPAAAVVLGFIVAGFLLQRFWPQPGLMRPLGYAPSFVLFPFVGLYAVALVVTRYRWRQRGEGHWRSGAAGWRAAWAEARAGAIPPARLARLGLACLFLPLLLNTFGCFKTAIPWWRGFAREEALLRLSRDLHGGVLEWYPLQAVAGHPVLTLALDRIYFTWLPVFVVVVVWQAGWREPAREWRRFMLALTLVWLGLGAVAATAGASAGPIFTDRVLPDSDAYAPLFRYLAAVEPRFHLVTLDVRDLLWAAHETRSPNPFTGISAFPSIHVAMAALYVPALWRGSRRLALAAAGYAALIALASVHLGWHYAVDAYAGAAGAALCWLAAGLLTRRSGHV